MELIKKILALISNKNKRGSIVVLDESSMKIDTDIKNIFKKKNRMKKK